MMLGKCAASCLDHVLIRAIDYEDVNSVLITEKIADHYFVGCQISSPEVLKPTETSTFIEIFDRTRLSISVRIQLEFCADARLPYQSL